MTTKERILTVLLGITGIVAAGGIALAANAVSGRDIGLSAQPVSLAASAPKPRPARVVQDRNDDHGGRSVTGLDILGVAQIYQHLRSGMHDTHAFQHGTAVICNQIFSFTGLYHFVHSSWAE